MGLDLKHARCKCYALLLCLCTVPKRELVYIRTQSTITMTNSSTLLRSQFGDVRACRFLSCYRLLASFVSAARHVNPIRTTRNRLWWRSQWLATSLRIPANSLETTCERDRDSLTFASPILSCCSACLPLSLSQRPISSSSSAPLTPLNKPISPPLVALASASVPLVFVCICGHCERDGSPRRDTSTTSACT